MTNLDSVLKSSDITLLTKVCIMQAVFSSSHVLLWELDHKEGCVHAKSFQSCLIFPTLWTVAHRASHSTRFSRQDYWSGLSCPPAEDVPNWGIRPVSHMSPALAGGFLTTSATWEALSLLMLLDTFSYISINTPPTGFLYYFSFSLLIFHNAISVTVLKCKFKELTP